MPLASSLTVRLINCSFWLAPRGSRDQGNGLGRLGSGTPLGRPFGRAEQSIPKAGSGYPTAVPTGKGLTAKRRAEPKSPMPGVRCRDTNGL